MYKFLVLAFVFGSPVMAQHRVTSLKSYAAEGIEVKSYDFKNFENFLKMSNDTTYVVNFWATWCTPCIKELPHFEKINRQYSGRKIKVLLVSMDLPRQAESRLLPFIKKKKLVSEVILLDDPDANSWIEKVDTSWSGAIPATVIYNGTNRKFYEQTFTYEQLETEINQFIKI